jgi:hypothetical protein
MRRPRTRAPTFASGSGAAVKASTELKPIGDPHPRLPLPRQAYHPACAARHAAVRRNDRALAAQSVGDRPAEVHVRRVSAVKNSKALTSSTARHRTAQHGTAPHRTARRSTAPHSRVLLLLPAASVLLQNEPQRDRGVPDDATWHAVLHAEHLVLGVHSGVSDGARERAHASRAGSAGTSSSRYRRRSAGCPQACMRAPTST